MRYAYRRKINQSKLLKISNVWSFPCNIFQDGDCNSPLFRRLEIFRVIKARQQQQLNHINNNGIVVIQQDDEEEIITNPLDASFTYPNFYHCRMNEYLYAYCLERMNIDTSVVLLRGVSYFLPIRVSKQKSSFNCSTAQQSTAQHRTARRGTARRGTARRGTARHGAARHGTAHCS